jgi:hypothetical protein
MFDHNPGLWLGMFGHNPAGGYIFFCSGLWEYNPGAYNPRLCNLVFNIPHVNQPPV